MGNITPNLPSLDTPLGLVLNPREVWGPSSHTARSPQGFECDDLNQQASYDAISRELCQIYNNYTAILLSHQA